jgi:outer membrane protein OmpA-like peptidoglycan-associated protein
LADGEGGEHYGELKNTTLEDLNGRLQALFPEQIQSGKMEIIGNESWLQIEVSSNLLFFSGSASMGYESEAIVNEIAGVLFDFENPIRVEGFTDNQPLSNEAFASNWELSSARSSAIVRQLVESGIAPSRLAAVGYGEYQPRASNDTAEGRALNRRVVFMVSRSENLRPSLVRLDSSASAPPNGGAESRTDVSEPGPASANSPLADDIEEAEVESLPLPEPRTPVVATKRQDLTANQGARGDNRGLIQRAADKSPSERGIENASDGWQLESTKATEQANSRLVEQDAVKKGGAQEDAPVPAQQAVEGVKTVKLKGGGLLFTSE